MTGALTLAVEPVDSLVDPTEDSLAPLLQAALGGDGQALDALYRATADELWGFALWRGGDSEIAADALQTVFCRLAGARPPRARIRSARAYLLAAVRRAVIDLGRRRALELDSESPLLVAAEESPERRADAALASRRLRQLPPRLRETVYLRHFAGLTFREIGAITHVPTFTAASRYRLGIERLRRELGEGKR